MLCLRGLLFCSFLLLFALVASASELPPAPLGTIDYSLSSTPLEISKGSPEHTSISLPFPNIVIEDHFEDFENYQVFGIPGEPFVMEDGVPSVPQVSRFYRIPNTGSAELVFLNTEFELIGNVKPKPYQIEEGGTFSRDHRSMVYTRDEWYPPVVAEMSSPVIMRDFRLVRVTLYPVQVNPVTGQARLYHHLSVDIVANDTPGENELLNPGPITKSWLPIYQSMIPNLDESALDQISEVPGTYLILAKTHAQINPWVDSLATWKKRKGYDVVVDARANWTISQMTAAVRDRYANLATRPEFVCIMGDPEWTQAGLPTDGSNYDHTFALGNTGDDLEDIGVGRLSANSNNKMGTINAKIMGYERNPHMETSGGDPDTMWFHRAFFYAGIGHQISSNWTGVQWGAQQYRTYTEVDCTYLRHHDGAVSWNIINDYLELGVSHFPHRASYIGEIDASQVEGNCPVTWRLPVHFVSTCAANDFSWGLGVAEAFLVAGTATSPKGAVASWGTATSTTTNPPNLTVCAGSMHAVADLHIEHYSHCLNVAKSWLALVWGPTHTYTNSYSRWNNLMGDPGLSVWTAVPNVMEVDHPTVINVGTHYISINVSDEDNGLPIEDALVCLWKGDETYERGVTDLNGHVELPLQIETAGNLSLTVSKRNHKPYLYEIVCAPAELMVALTHYTIDDDNAGGTQGNADGIVNPAEIIDLPVYLQNYGSSTTATNVSATLVSQNPRITVLSGASIFPNINPGDTSASATPFRIGISPQMQDGETALLVFTITASAIQTTSALELSCTAGKVEYNSHQFTGTVNPGTTNNLRVTLHNGSATRLLDEVTGTLQSLSPFVQVDDAGGTFGDIAPNGNATNTADQFTLTSNSLTFRGHQAPMRLIIATADDFADTVQFVVSIGTAASTDPTGPDAYGYFAYDNTDVSYEMHPTYEYVDISAGLGTDLNINDIGVETSITQNFSVARQLPFTFTFYGETYDSVTICSNGWIAFGNQAWNDVFRNYPMPAILAPEAMVAPYWDDLKTDGALGVWEYHDAANDRFIVQWKAQVYEGPTNLNFEVILLNEETYPTFDGNGQILCQYNDVTMGVTGWYEEPNGCTIGIQKPQNLVGLQYAFITSYMPGAATMVDGRAILFTTSARMLFGAIQGTVLNAETNQPVPNVDITIDGYSYHTTTDAAGHYFLDDVLIGIYTVRAHKRQFNDGTVANVVVELDSTETINFSMLHPELALSDDTLDIALTPPDPVETVFDIVNDGNGPLDYSVLITYAGDGSPDPWDSLGNINLTEATGDFMVQGCEFIGDYWWISGGSGQNGNNFFYRFDTDGNYIDAIPQPSTTAFGWFDMTYDGEYLYGSDGPFIIGVDEQAVARDTIDSPLNPSRAIAYDEVNDRFWAADYGSDIFAINRQGQVIHQVPNEGSNELLITGLAWNELDADGFKLYIFAQNGAGTQTQLWRMHPGSFTLEFITTLQANPGDHAGGLAITPGWNSTLLVLGGILQNSGGDRLGIYEITFNTTWIDVFPMQNQVVGGGVQEVTVAIDPTFLRPDVYRVDLNISSMVLDTTYVLPVVLTVLNDVPETDEPLLPESFALYQNYPNPFNPSTEIRFDVPETGWIELTIYNTLGQAVRTLLSDIRTAGSYRATWDGRNDSGASLATGVYICTMRTGSFAQARKMVLMR